MMHLTLSSLLCSELSFVRNQAAEVDYRLVTVNNNLNQPGHEANPYVILGFQLRNRILAAEDRWGWELKSKWIMVYLKQCRYCVVNVVQRSGALDVVELGCTSVLLGVAISSRHLSVFGSFLFFLVPWRSTRQSRYVGEGSCLLESRLVGSKVVRNLTQNTWFQLTILYTLQL